MSLSIGIIGLPNAGKSTLFNALASKQIAQTASYPFTTIDPNIATVPIPNQDLSKIAQISNSKETIYSSIKFIDIAGLIKDAHKGEGLGNQFLAHIKEVDLVLFLLRVFENDNIPKAASSPQKELEILKTELILKDLQTLEKQPPPKKNAPKEEKKFYQIVLKLISTLNKGQFASSSLTPEEKKLIRPLFLLTAKPYIIVLNIDESQIPKTFHIKKKYPSDPIVICAKLEEDLISFSTKEKGQYLKSLNIKGSGLNYLVLQAFQKLNLITFITTNKNQTHSWTIKKNTPAIKAAKIVHTDFAKNFIKAQIAKVKDFIKYKGWKNLKEKGLIKLEGRNYPVKDKDIIHFLISS